MELNREKVIKALELHSKLKPCMEVCPYGGENFCGGLMAADALKLIKELTVEVEALRGAANSYKMHYENVKADTVRNMQKRLREEPIKVGLPLRGLRGRAAVEEYADELILQIGEIINKVAEEMLKEN